MEEKRPYTVRVLDAKYEPHDACLVINGLIEDYNERRLFILPKQDFVFKGKKDFPDIEMYRTAALMKGKRIRMIIHDDPNRKILDKKEQEVYAELFKEEIMSNLNDITKGLVDDNRKIENRLQKLIKDGKIDLSRIK